MFQRVLSIYKEFLFQFQGFLFPIPGIISLQHTIHAVPIIGLHFLCFKTVSLMAVGAYGMKPYMLAAFPVLMTTGWWWIGYVAVGIAVPLVVDWGWRKCIHWQTHRSVQNISGNGPLC